MNFRTLPFALLILVFIVVGVDTSEAQFRGSRSWRRLDVKEREARHQFVVDVVLELKRSVGEKINGDMLSRFEGMARSVVRRMSKEDFEKLQAKPIADRVRSVAVLWKKSKEEAAQRFMQSQTPGIIAELRALNPHERDRRIAELKVLATLERSIAAAEKYQLIQPSEADRLRGLSSSDQLAASKNLNRQVFFSIHGAEVDAKEKARLEQLDDHEFWRDRSVRRFQLLQHINAKELEKLRKLDHSARMTLFKSLRSGNGLEALVESGTLSQRTATKWIKLKPDDRRRLMRDLQRVYLPNFQEGLRPSRKQFGQLSREERHQLFMMNAKERLDFLKSKFPSTDWDQQEATRKLRIEIDRQLESMDRRARNQLRSMMPAVVKKKMAILFPDDVAKVNRMMADMEKVNWFRSVVPGARMLRSQLSDEERKSLQSKTTEEQVDFYFVKFSQTLDKQAIDVLTRAGKEIPANWADLSGSAKVTHLNELGLRMPWGPHDSKFRRRGRRPDKMGPPPDGQERPRSKGPGGHGRRRGRGGRPESRPNEGK